MKELLDRDDIVRFLREVADELPERSYEEVVVVGGSMLAFMDLRDATRDVDTSAAMSHELVGAGVPSCGSPRSVAGMAEQQRVGVRAK